MTSLLKSGNADYVVRSAITNISKFFSKGWGDPDLMQRICAFQHVVLDKRKFVRDVYGTLEKTDIKLSKGKKVNSSMTLYTGEFISPLNKFIPRALPKECEKAGFQLVIPNNWKSHKPVTIHLAGTGDHFFWRRRLLMASPLAKDGIASIILENPFYGRRKPKGQNASAVNYVSDIFTMGAALLVESVVLMFLCQRLGLGPLGITGISMGGHMASVAASGWFEPISIVPCLSYTSAAPCFTEGVLSQAIDWQVLERQLDEIPEYRKLLRDDSEFKRNLVHHYTNSSYLTTLRAQQEEDSGLLNTQYNQLYSSVSSIVESIKPWSYIDYQGKRLGSMIVEADVWKYMLTISKQFPDFSSTYKRLNLEMLGSMIWNNNGSPDFKPSQETLDYMVTIMDQGTHLKYYNKPHPDSSIIYVNAEHDRYFPKESFAMTPKDVWEQTEMRSIDCGHVLGVLQHQSDFRNAIKDSFQALGCSF